MLYKNIYRIVKNLFNIHFASSFLIESMNFGIFTCFFRKETCVVSDGSSVSGLVIFDK